MMEDSRWSDIFTCLQQAGYDVYPPATKEGECTQPYLVVKDAGVTEHASISSNIALFDIMVYMPRNQYSKLENYVKGVQQAMDALFPMIRPTHFVTASFFDDTVKGWMQSIQYQNYQKKVRA